MTTEVCPGITCLRQYDGVKVILEKTFEGVVEKLESCEAARVQANERLTCKDCRYYAECTERYARLCGLVKVPRQSNWEWTVH